MSTVPLWRSRRVAGGTCILNQEASGSLQVKDARQAIDKIQFFQKRARILLIDKGGKFGRTFGK